MALDDNLSCSEDMNMSGESLIVILLVGVIAGWLAGQIVRHRFWDHRRSHRRYCRRLHRGLAAAAARYPAWCRDGRSDHQRDRRRYRIAARCAARPRRQLLGEQRLGIVAGAVKPTLVIRARKTACRAYPLSRIVCGPSWEFVKCRYAAPLHPCSRNSIRFSLPRLARR